MADIKIPIKEDIKVKQKFLLIPNSEKKRWAEDIIHYGPGDFRATVEPMKDKDAIRELLFTFITEMRIAHKFLGKKSPL